MDRRQASEAPLLTGPLECRALCDNEGAYLQFRLSLRCEAAQSRKYRLMRLWCAIPTSSEIDLKYLMDSSSSRIVICLLSCAAYGFFFAAEFTDKTRCCSLKLVRPEPVQGRMGFDKLSPNGQRNSIGIRLGFPGGCLASGDAADDVAFAPIAVTVNQQLKCAAQAKKDNALVGRLFPLLCPFVSGVWRAKSFTWFGIRCGFRTVCRIGHRLEFLRRIGCNS